MSWMKQYMLSGFATKEELLIRNSEFVTNFGHKPNDGISFMFEYGQLSEYDWGMIVPEANLDLLNESERTSERLHEIPKPEPRIEPYAPMVFRYLEKEFVDLFFDKGILRLSSFRQFKKHKDEQRGDKSEGTNLIHATGGMTMMTFVNSGSNAFVLSTSLKNSKSLCADFNYDACFVIENPVDFLITIGSKLGDLRGALLGPCIYQPVKIITRNMPGLSLEGLKSDYGGIDPLKMHQQSIKTGGNDVFFTKTNVHSHQNEFRFLWFLWEDKVEDHILIEVPEAIKFCSKFEFTDI